MFKYRASSFLEIVLAWKNLFFIIISRPPKPPKFKIVSPDPRKNAIAKEAQLNQFAALHTSQFVSFFSLLLSIASLIISLKK